MAITGILLAAALTFDFRSAIGHDLNETNAYPEATFIVRQAAHGFVEKTFAVGEGQAGLVAYFWKCPHELVRDRRRTSFRVTVPKGFEYVDAAFAEPSTVTREPSADGGETVTFGLNLSKFHGPFEKFNGWYRLGLLVRSTGAVGEAGELGFEIRLDGKPASNPERTKLFTVPAVRVAAPKRYVLGAYFGGWYCLFPTKEGNDAFARMLADAGVRWVVPAIRSDLAMASWRAAGIRYITPDWYWIADGFRVGNPKGRPAADRLVITGEGKAIADADQYTCPRRIYLEDDYFRTNTVPELKEYLKGCDGLSANWEPEPFFGRACSCAACEREAREAGLPWYRFRSLQHARVAKVIDRYVREATGGENSLGFIPAVNEEVMNDEKYRKTRGFEMWVQDYADTLRWINPWGPYMYWETKWRYNVKAHDGLNVCQFVIAKNTRECVDRDYRAGAKPRLLAFPHASQIGGDYEWLTQPEWLEVAMNSHFVNGWEACMAYMFPRGYDARYLAAFARATALAARWEDFVFDGERCDAAVTTEADAVRTFPKPWYSHQWMTDIPLVQHVAYRKGDTLWACVFNFSSEEPVNVTVRCAGRTEVVALPPCGCKTLLLSGTVPEGR